MCVNRSIMKESGNGDLQGESEKQQKCTRLSAYIVTKALKVSCRRSPLFLDLDIIILL